MDYKVVKECRVCGSPDLQKYLDLGSAPLANSLLSSLEQVSNTYPIEVMLCLECSLSQLSIVVEPKVMYSNYYYYSSISDTFKKHCRDMAVSLKELKPEYSYEKDSDGRKAHILDIASNDGCLLGEFKNEGYWVSGIEPSQKQCDIANSNGIPTECGFWGDGRGRHTDSSYDFITATNVLAHVDDLGGFLKSVVCALKMDGVFVAEFPYLPNLIENNQFDTIYHEHLSYFLLKPLVRLFKDNGLPIFKVERKDIHGGSIRIYASKFAHDQHESVKDMLDFEESKELYSIETYTKFADRALRVMNDFRMCLQNIYDSGKKVMAYGASAKGISLMNYAGIRRDWIHAIVDDTPDKQGKWTPGTLIPIIDSNSFKDECAYFIVLLAWNFSRELMAKCWWHSGYFIIPIPEVKIV